MICYCKTPSAIMCENAVCDDVLVQKAAMILDGLTAMVTIVLANLEAIFLTETQKFCSTLPAQPWRLACSRGSTQLLSLLQNLLIQFGY